MSGNVQNEAAAISQNQQLIHRGIYIQTQLQQCKSHYIRTREWPGGDRSKVCEQPPVVRLASDRPDRLVCGNIKLICSSEYRSLILSSLFVAPDGMHQFVKLAELLICMTLA